MTPFLGCIADDYTGATDLATNLVESGVRTIQWFGSDIAPEMARDVDAVETEADAINAGMRCIPAFSFARPGRCARLPQEGDPALETDDDRGHAVLGLAGHHTFADAVVGDLSAALCARG